MKMSLTVGKVGLGNSYSNKIAFGSKLSPLAKFDIINPELWAKCVNNNTDPYGRAAISYAARWANMMEEAMSKGAKLEDIAKETSYKADTEGITGFMYGCAVNALSGVWKHGETLKNWHNAQYGIEKGAKGVVNPAILTIKTK